MAQRQSYQQLYGDYMDAEYGSSHYSAPINTIYNYQTTDIRALIPPEFKTTISNTHDLSATIHKHNAEVFGFIGSDLSGSVAEAVFRRFGLDTRPINRQYKPGAVTAELGLDSDLAAAKADLDAAYAAAFACDGSGAVSPTTLQGALHGIRWMAEQYKKIGEAVSRKETLINQKLIELDLVTKKVNLFGSLPENEASDALARAFESYVDTTFKSANIPAMYTEMVEDYKKWCMLREALAVPLAIEGRQGAESACSICLVESVTHCVSPCGHTFCAACVRKMNTACYLCRGAIRDRVRLFFN